MLGLSPASIRVWTHGEAADCAAYTKLIDRPDRAPKALLADKGYDTNAIRAGLARREIQAVIPAKSNRREKSTMIAYSIASAMASSAHLVDWKPTGASSRATARCH